MTLVMSLFGSDFVILISDRRLSSNGRVIEDESNKPTVILIEDKASGTQLIQDLRREGRRVQGCTPDGDKVMRLHVRTPWFEGGMVHLPKQAPWLADYRKELLSFPKTKHFDQVDSTTQALTWADKPRGEVRLLSGGRRIASELDRYVLGSASYFVGY